MGITVARGMTHDGLGQVPLEDPQEGARAHRRHRRDPQGHQDRRGGELPAGRLGDGHQVVRRTDPRSRLRVRQLHPGLHRQRPLLAEAVRGTRPADHRRRHQKPGRRDHHPPRADLAVCRPRRASGQDLPAQLRRQHRFPEHARARAARIQEDLQDQRGHLAAAVQDRRQTTCTSAPATTCRG